jgi:hypothetical protein
VELIRIEPTTGIARVIVRFVRNLGIARRARRVRTECAIHAVKPAIPRANVIQIDAKHAAAQTIETLGASHALSTSVRNAKARWIQKGTIRTIARKY